MTGDATTQTPSASSGDRFHPYASYKDSGIDWLGEIPAHWETLRLRFTVTECRNGLWGEEPDGLNDVVCVRVADFDRVRFGVGFSEPTYRAIDPSTVSKRRIRRNDLLLEKSGGGENQPVGAIVLNTYQGIAICSNFVARMPVKEDYDARYLTYLHAALYSARINTRSIKQNTGIQNLDSDSYLNEYVALPRKAEQLEISEFLDRETEKIDALVAKKERLIELLTEKRAALITQAVTKGLDADVPMKESGFPWLGEIPVGWGFQRLKNIVRKIGSGKTPAGGAERYVAEGVMLLRSQNVQFGGLELTGVACIDDSIDNEMSGSRVAENDVLLNITGASLGRCCVARLDGLRANVNQHVCIVRPDPHQVDAAFLARSLESRTLQDQIFNNENGVSRDALNFEQIGALLLSFPAIDDQRAIAAFLDRETGKIDALLAKVREAIDRLTELRTALISAAVTGKIDVRGPGA